MAARKKIATAKPKPPSKSKAATAAKTSAPSLTELTKWYQQLLRGGTYTSDCEGQAFFYDAIWSDDHVIERAFERFCEETQRKLGHDYEPMGLYEEKLVTGGHFAELHAFFSSLPEADLKRTLPEVKAFIAHPKRAKRYEKVGE